MCWGKVRREDPFCFDYLSPYAYLASTQIHRIAGAANEVEPVPVLFAGLLEAHGTRGPAEVPAKKRYLLKDIMRIADRFGVPISAPPALPFRSLHALRVSSIPIEPEARRRLIDRLYAGVWARGEDLTDRAVLERIVREVGLDPELVARAETPEIKQRLKAQTDDAIALGVFGVPTSIVGEEIFWGTDSLPHLERYLEGHDPVTPERMEAFLRIPVGAARKIA